MSKASGSINSWLLMGVLVLVVVIGGVLFLKQMERSPAPPEPQPAKRFKIPTQQPPQTQLAQNQPAEKEATPPAASTDAPAAVKQPDDVKAPPSAEKTAAVPPLPKPKTVPDATDQKAPSDASTAAAAPAVLDPNTRFPFSVSLGSFSNRDNAYKVIEQNRKAGLLPYSVKVNLGSKGTWYRVFLGYFPSKEAADQYISDNRLKTAKSEKTRFAAQIGVFPSHEKLKTSTDTLTKLGYYPYTLQRDADQIALLIGAFYAKPEAQKHCQILKSAGMRCEVIER